MLAALFFTWLAIASAVPLVIDARAPDLALRLASNNSIALAARAAQLLTEDATQEDLAKARDFAQRALRRDPTNAAAARVIAYSYNDDFASGLPAAAYSRNLSRRDVLNNFYLIEYETGRDGDIAAILRNYDIALRTSRASQDLLFPILSKALNDPDIRARLIPILGEKPAWRDAFITYAISENASPVDVLRLEQGLRRTRSPISENLDQALIARLGHDNFYEEAFALYRQLRPQTAAARRYLGEGNFEEVGTDYPFSWSLASASAGTAQVSPRPADDKNMALWVLGEAGTGGEVARQAVTATPGRYRFAAVGGSLATDARQRPSFQFLCVKKGVFARILPPAAGERGGSFSDEIEFPANCGGYIMTVTTPAAPDHNEAWFDDITLTRLQ